MYEKDPYQPPESRLVEDVEPEIDDAPLAGRIIRLGARLVDMIFYGFPAVVSMMLFCRTDPEADVEAFLTDPGVVLAASWMAVLFLINLRVLALQGQTLGKGLFGIRIVRTDGSPARVGRILALRMIAPCWISGLSYVGDVFSLANTLAIFSESRRCVHDYMADTKVVKVVRESAAASGAVPEVVEAPVDQPQGLLERPGDVSA